MKSLTKAIAVVAFVVTPIASFAQSSQPLTRAQVREELVQLYNVGYMPLDDRNRYPAHIQAAEARIAAQKEAAATDTSGYGPATAGSAQVGLRP
jgi:Domain of unknown function (DUF4148)